jgi:hypothetical protein
MHRITLFLISLLTGFYSFSTPLVSPLQQDPVDVIDTIPANPILFNAASASRYISRMVLRQDLWRPAGAEIKNSILRLMDQYNDPYDSVLNRLSRTSFDPIRLQRTYISHNDTLPLRWLNRNTFFIDTIALDKEPFITRQTVMLYAIDTSNLPGGDRTPELEALINTVLQARDTITERFIDTLYLQARRVKLHRIVDEEVIPPVITPSAIRSVRFLPDSSKVIISENHRAIMADRQSPYHLVPNELMPDSLRAAVETLLLHNETRDSILVFLSSRQGRRIPFWLSTKNDEYYRFWVKNLANDSITVWISNPAKYDISLLLEDNVNVERREKRLADDVPITTIRPVRTIARMSPLKEIPVYWKYNFETAFMLNQTFFSNWAKGGENSFSNMLDMKSGANYINNERKTKWINNGRLRYGSIVSKIDDKYMYRTNADLLEFNSQFNRSLKGKVDFSTVGYFKTQVAKGYKSPKDTIPISKFLSPGTFTVGVGVEYKPEPKTRINFSPLSYRNTFVMDTANINQKAHGIDLDKRSRQEMGGQLTINNSVVVTKGLTVTNAVRLFSGYLEKPENVDVDWEIGIDRQINWFFMIRLNLHFIYDDDIKIPVLDAAGQPVKLPDGTNKRVSKLQFKEFLGLTMSFKI